MATQEQFQQLLDHLKQKDDQVSALTQQFQQIQQDMLTMRTHHDATVNTLQNALQQTVQTVATAKASNKTLVDGEGIGKPNTFDSDMKKFPNFSFKFKNFVSSVFENARSVMDWAEEQMHSITASSVQELSN